MLLIHSLPVLRADPSLRPVLQKLKEEEKAGWELVSTVQIKISLGLNYCQVLKLHLLTLY